MFSFCGEEINEAGVCLDVDGLFIGATKTRVELLANTTDPSAIFGINCAKQKKFMASKRKSFLTNS
jgi:hypothetical protein